MGHRFATSLLARWRGATRNHVGKRPHVARRLPLVASVAPPLPLTLGEEAADQPHFGPERTRHRRSRVVLARSVTAMIIDPRLPQGGGDERRIQRFMGHGAGDRRLGPYSDVLGQTSVPLAAVLPLVLISVGFVVYCLVDVARASSARLLPKWLWARI